MPITAHLLSLTVILHFLGCLGMMLHMIIISIVCDVMGKVSQDFAKSEVNVQETVLNLYYV